ncbi:putative peroxidase [Edaphobacter dinghuensis]|uniref:Peroxidase n=2 Tax=Edaphobacter dinghuensis TaxID=1560005 RepID=A0A917M4B9_9BACT|nr:putative peroxidase [Edaphobacter dinghuensis]
MCHEDTAMKVLKAIGIAAGGALAAAAAVKILRSGRCKQVLLDGFNRTCVRVDQKIGWPALPVPLALGVLAGYRNTVREKNLTDTNTPDTVPGTPPSYPNVVTARTPDGTFNDLKCPFMGSAGARFGRNVPLEETWQQKMPELMTPSPRVVSLELMTRNEFTPAKTLNLLAAAWLQFQIRDWFSHGKSVKEDPWQVPLAQNDTWHENPMQVLRVMPDPTRTPADEGKPLTYVNTETHWWDGSQLYGSTADYRAKVRTGVDGKIFVGKDHLVHPDPTALVQLQSAALVGWWVGLELFFTLFTLEHNAICDRLKQEYPEWGDDDLFEHARLINAAIIAKIHTVEWTTAILGHPVLQIAMRSNWWGLAGEHIKNLFGRLSGSELISGIPGSETDHFGVPYSLTEEFVAVYRMHPLIPDDITFWSRETGDVLQKLNFQQIAGNDAQNICDSVHIEDLLYSFGLMNPGAVVLHNYPKTLQHFVRPDGILMDLAAHDIMRCRELGVPRYTKFRKLLNLRPVTTFEELTPNVEWREEIRRVYNNDIDSVDLIVGLFAEKPPEGFGFSDTAFRIFILMASRRLNSDRFFTTDFTEDVYSKAGMDWIRDSTLSTVLLRHYPSLAPALEGVENGFAPWKAKGAQT